MERIKKIGAIALTVFMFVAIVSISYINITKAISVSTLDDLQNQLNSSINVDIILLDNITVIDQSTLTCSTGYTYTIDLNGKTLSLYDDNTNVANGCITITNGSVVTIKDTSMDHNGKVINNNLNKDEGTTFYVESAKLFLESGIFEGNRDVVKVDNTSSDESGASTLQVNGGQLISSNQEGSVIFNIEDSYCKLTINDGTFEFDEGHFINEDAISQTSLESGSYKNIPFEKGGYIFTKDDTVYYTVSKGFYVGNNTGSPEGTLSNPFSSITSACNFANNILSWDTYEVILLSDSEVEYKINIPASNKVTIKGNTDNIKIIDNTTTDGNPLFSLDNGQKVVLDNVTIDGISRTGTTTYGVIVLRNNGALTLTNGSSIKNYNEKVVNISSAGVFTMNEGTSITGCTAPTNEGDSLIFVNGKFNLYGGTITGNQNTAVYVNESATMNVKGNAKVDNNTLNGGTLNPNIYLQERALITIEESLGENAILSVGSETQPTAASGVTITNTATEGDLDKFKADNENQAVSYAEGKILLVKNSSVWGANGSAPEKNKLSFYNPRLAEITGENPTVYEVNKTNNSKDNLSKTFTTTSGSKYTFKFDYTNRTSLNPTQEQNTFEVWILPGEEITTTDPSSITDAVKLGKYYGSNTVWNHAVGEFTASSDQMTLMFVPLTSSGIGCIVKDMDVSDVSYSLNTSNADSFRNLLKNAKFEDTTDDWNNTKDDVEVNAAANFMTDTSTNSSKIAEINGFVTDDTNKRWSLYQTIGQYLSICKIDYSFDLARSNSGDEDHNYIDVYLVKLSEVEDFDTKGIRIASALGAQNLWQTVNGSYNVNNAFLDTDEVAIVFSTRGTTSPYGGLIDNVAVFRTENNIVVVDRTDTSITLTEVEGAEYTLTDGDSPIVQPSNVFTGLEPGKTYSYSVKIYGKEEATGTVTTKASAPVNSNPLTMADITKTDTSISFVGIEGKEYTIDGINWISGTGETITFDELTTGQEYTLYERIEATYETAAGQSNELVITLGSSSSDTSAAKPATLNNRTDTSITINGVDGEEYSIDGVTWKSGKTVVFDNLQPGTAYEILSRVKATDTTPAGAITKTVIKTVVKASGKVTSTSLPATIQIIDPATGKVIETITTDAQGNWSTYLDIGEYEVKVISENKKEESTFEMTVSKEKDNVYNTTTKKVKTSDMLDIITPTIGFVLSAIVLTVFKSKKKEV